MSVTSDHAFDTPFEELSRIKFEIGASAAVINSLVRGGTIQEEPHFGGQTSGKFKIRHRVSSARLYQFGTQLDYLNDFKHLTTGCNFYKLGMRLATVSGKRPR